MPTGLILSFHHRKVLICEIKHSQSLLLILYKKRNFIMIKIVNKVKRRRSMKYSSQDRTGRSLNDDASLSVIASLLFLIGTCTQYIRVNINCIQIICGYTICNQKYLNKLMSILLLVLYAVFLFFFHSFFLLLNFPTSILSALAAYKYFKCISLQPLCHNLIIFGWKK